MRAGAEPARCVARATAGGSEARLQRVPRDVYLEATLEGAEDALLELRTGDWIQCDFTANHFETSLAVAGDLPAPLPDVPGVRELRIELQGNRFALQLDAMFVSSTVEGLGLGGDTCALLVAGPNAAVRRFEAFEKHSETLLLETMTAFVYPSLDAFRRIAFLGTPEAAHALAVFATLDARQEEAREVGTLAAAALHAMGDVAKPWTATITRPPLDEDVSPLDGIARDRADYRQALRTLRDALAGH